MHKMTNHIFLLPLLLISRHFGASISAFYAPASAPISTKAPANAPIGTKAPASAPIGTKARDSSLRETLAQAQIAHELISIMDPSSFHGQARTAWDDCKDLYQDSIDRLNQSIASKNNRNDVQTWLSASLANEQTCQDGFLDLGLPSLSSLSPSFNLANANFTKSIYNALVISKAISSPSPLAKHGKISDRKLLQFSGELERAVDIVVAQDGSGSYETINEGLAAARAARTKGVVVHVKKGIYKETVVVDKHLKNLRMIGDGIDETIITGSNSVRNGSSTFRSATVSKLITPSVPLKAKHYYFKLLLLENWLLMALQNATRIMLTLHFIYNGS